MPLYVIGNEKTAEVISKRDEFIRKYCDKKGWVYDPENMSLD